MAKDSGKIAIVGAGLTGLVAARRLARKGYAVDVYEAAGEAGGLAAGFTLRNGTRLERAYHFVYPSDQHLIRLAEELDLRDALKFHRSSIGAFYRGGLYPLLTATDLLRFPALGWFSKVRTGLVALYLQRVRRWDKLTCVTAMEWLQRFNGRHAAAVLWQPLLRGKFDRHYDKITMAWLWGRIRQRQESRRTGARHELLGCFDGSFTRLIAALESDLAALDATMHWHTPVERITRNADGGLSVTAGGGAASFDAVLATVPSGVFAGQIEGNPSADEPYLARLRSIEYLAAVLMVVVTPQELSDYYWHQFHDGAAPFLVALRLTALTGDTRPFGGNHVYYIGDYVTAQDPLLHRSDDDIRAQWMKDLAGLFPRFDPHQVCESHIFRFRYAQHVVDVGYETRKLVSLRTPVPGVYLANFSQIFPQDRGTNHAVRDGEDSAAAIDGDLRAR